MGVVTSAVILMGILGFGFGVFLAYAAKVFYVKEDPRVELVAKVLPGANCGMCGYPGCDAYARAIVKKGENPGRCVPGKPMGVEVKIREILKLSPEEAEKRLQGD
ncbi:MAG: RnfABCDGE type electron transport complex subunit B [Thermotogaceae bacterium]|nr:RnfABCDGE type electron transport complex subunit B [Thermotogaceae bacterium]